MRPHGDDRRVDAAAVVTDRADRMRRLKGLVLRGLRVGANARAAGEFGIDRIGPQTVVARRRIELVVTVALFEIIRNRAVNLARLDVLQPDIGAENGVAIGGGEIAAHPGVVAGEIGRGVHRRHRAEVVAVQGIGVAAGVGIHHRVAVRQAGGAQPRVAKIFFRVVDVRLAVIEADQVPQLVGDQQLDFPVGETGVAAIENGITFEKMGAVLEHDGGGETDDGVTLAHAQIGVDDAAVAVVNHRVEAVFGVQHGIGKVGQHRAGIGQGDVTAEVGALAEVNRRRGHRVPYLKSLLQQAVGGGIAARAQRPGVDIEDDIRVGVTDRGMPLRTGDHQWATGEGAGAGQHQARQGGRHTGHPADEAGKL